MALLVDPDSSSVGDVPLLGEGASAGTRLLAAATGEVLDELLVDLAVVFFLFAATAAFLFDGLSVTSSSASGEDRMEASVMGDVARDEGASSATDAFSSSACLEAVPFLFLPLTTVVVLAGVSGLTGGGLGLEVAVAAAVAASSSSSVARRASFMASS